MTPWEEYRAAVTHLAEVRRRAAADAAARGDALQAAREELVVVRRRLTIQQVRFAEACGRYRVRLPGLTPSNAEINAALEPGSDPAAVLGALRRARSTLDDMDAALADLRRPRRAARLATLIRALRSRIIYGAMALVVLGLLTLGGYALLR